MPVGMVMAVVVVTAVMMGVVVATLVTVVMVVATLVPMDMVMGARVVMVDPDHVRVQMDVDERSVAVLVCVRRVLVLRVHVAEGWHEVRVPGAPTVSV